MIGSPLRTLVRRAVVVPLALAVALAVAGPAAAAVAKPPTPNFGPQIDGYANADPAKACDAGTKPGTAEFKDMILDLYPYTTSLGTYDCDLSDPGGHDEGRAWDWGVDVRDARDKETADAVIAWLLATDEYGNPHALARRLGINFIIWNRRIVYLMNSNPNHGWQPYSGASAHTDHVHFEFSWAGARKETTWWKTSGDGTRDVTGDRRGDLPVQTKEQYGDGSLYVFRGGNGDGFWESVPTPYRHSPANGRNKITVSDITGDGIDDLVVAAPNTANPDTTTLRLLKGGTIRNGVGAGTVLREFGEPVENITLAGGNFTGNKPGDLAVQVKEQNGNGTLYVYQGGNGDNFFGEVLVPYGNSPANGRNKITVSDITGDGTGDLVVASPNATNPDTTTLRLLKGGTIRSGVGAGTVLREFGEPVENMDLAGGNVAGGKPGDLAVQVKEQNGDGTLYVFQGGNGDNFWGEVLVPYKDSPANGRNKITTSDLNGDGFGDLIVASPNATNPNTTTLRLLKGGTIRNGVGAGTALREFGEPVESIDLP